MTQVFGDRHGLAEREDESRKLTEGKEAEMNVLLELATRWGEREARWLLLIEHPRQGPTQIG